MGMMGYHPEELRHRQYRCLPRSHCMFLWLCRRVYAQRANGDHSDGNDGPWSSFFIAVGSPAQTLRVFISTAVSATWVIISKGCPASVTTCPSLRGGIYDSNTSTTWQNQGDYELYVEGNLGIVGAGIFGNDSIGIGSDGGPVLQNQIIGGIAAEQFWLGMLGVNPKPTNFTTFESSQASFMDTLKEQDLIPSVSFGYTAGNQYSKSFLAA